MISGRKARLAVSRISAPLSCSAQRLQTWPQPPSANLLQAALVRQRGESELPASAVTLLQSFGFESAKRSNVHYIADEVLVFVTGNTVTFLNTATAEQSYLPQV